MGRDMDLVSYCRSHLVFSVILCELFLNALEVGDLLQLLLADRGFCLFVGIQTPEKALYLSRTSIFELHAAVPADLHPPSHVGLDHDHCS
jgi:hypothetical protein